MKVILTVEQANELLAYLQSKPWSEVNKLIFLIQKSIVKDEEAKDGSHKSNS